jgi:hypothetical protein
MFHHFFKYNLIFFIGLSVFVQSGCGKQSLPEGMPKPYPTEIIVNQEGTPLKNASVVLLPADLNSLWNAYGLTNDSGVAKIATKGSYAGAVPGKYKIIITLVENEPSKLVKPDVSDRAAYGKWLEESAQEKPASFDLVDTKYGDFQSTPEEIEIVAGSNTKTVEVGAPVRIKRTFNKGKSPKGKYK